MRDLTEFIFSIFIRMVAILTIIILALIIFFILQESTAFFKEVSIVEFIFGRSWKPLAISDEPSYSILPMILTTLYTSLIAIIIVLPIGVGCALFLSVYLSQRMRNMIKPFIDFLAGVPSVVYGMVGLLVLVKHFERIFHMSSGESVLAGGILLSVMVLPYMISTCDETMAEIMDRYQAPSQALGIPRIYMISRLILPGAKKSIVAGIILALARAMGETMAVMMVIGNAPIMPKLLGKSQTISALIALEMGGVTINSTHYHALFAAGFVLMIMLLLINIVVYYVRKTIKI